MSEQFNALVSLLRAAETKQIDAARSRLSFRRAHDAQTALPVLEASNKFEGHIRLFQNGVQIFAGAEALRSTEPLEIEIDAEVSGNNWGAWQNLARLLPYQNGKFLAKAPDNYYLIDEDVTSSEHTDIALLASYRRLPNLLALLGQISDAQYPSQGVQIFVFVAGAGLLVPVSYNERDLEHAPITALLTRATEKVLTDPRRVDRISLFKRVLVRALQDSPENSRFSELMRRFKELLSGFEADFDHFASEFAFEKLRDQFERKKVDYMQKIASAVDGVLAKVLAIPIGQAVVVSQFKPDASAGLANAALITGSAIFTVIGILVFVNQLMVLRELRRDIGDEHKMLLSKHPDLHDRLKGVFDAAKRRSGWLGQGIASFTMLLLVAGFLFSLAAFDRVPPSSGAIEASLRSLVSQSLSIDGPPQ